MYSYFSAPLLAATPISVSIPTLVIEALIFGGVVWIMEVFVFAPIRKAWRERDEAIQAGLSASSDTRAEADESRDAVRQVLMRARQEAQAAIDVAVAEGNTVRAEQIAEANAEFQRLVNDARVQIQAEQAQVAAQLQDRAVDLALAVASRVTGTPYDTPETRELAAAVVGREALL